MGPAREGRRREACGTGAGRGVVVKGGRANAESHPGRSATPPGRRRSGFPGQRRSQPSTKTTTVAAQAKDRSWKRWNCGPREGGGGGIMARAIIVKEGQVRVGDVPCPRAVRRQSGRRGPYVDRVAGSGR